MRNQQTMIMVFVILALCLVTGASSMAAEEKGTAGTVSVNSIEVAGNKTFSDLRLKLRMKLWSSSLMPGVKLQVNRKWVKRDLKNLVEFYRKKRFADVVVKSRIVDLKEPGRSESHEEKKVLHIDISEGLRYDLVFTGNTFFSEKELAEEVNLFEKGNAGDVSLRRGRVNIEKRYRKSGFKEAAARFEKEKITKEGGDSWKVTYTIDQGKRMVVKSLRIQGNEKIDTKTIKAAMLTRKKQLFGDSGFSRSTLEKDLNAVELVYLGRGYLNARIEEEISVQPDPDIDAHEYPVEEVSITVSIREGEQTLVAGARVTGLGDVVPEKKVLESVALKPGEPFREYMVKSDANAIAAVVSEKGYPHVTVKESFQLNEDKTRAQVSWKVSKGPFTRVGSIDFSGNSRLKEKLIKKKLKIEPGSVFSLKELFAAEKRIRTIGAVASVRIKAPELKGKNSPVDLVVAVEEKKPYFVEAAAGYDTEINAYLKAKTGDNNFLGRDIQAWIGGEVSSIGYRTETGVQNPFFMDRNLLVKATLFAEKEEALNQDFGTESWGASLGFSRPFFERFTAGLNFKYENRSRFGGDAGGTASANDEDQFRPRDLLVTSSSLVYDGRDSAIHPTKGIFSSAAIDLYTGFSLDLDRFLKYRLDIRKYYSPFQRITFAFLSRMGYIDPLGSSGTVAEDQLFFLGGISDVRGFKENMLMYDGDGDPAGGLSSVAASMEARIDLAAGFELTLFVDTGKLDDTLAGTLSDGFRTSVGTGLRYMTPIGPVGLLYGRKIDPRDGESSGRFHFAIGYTF
ncbi:MAG: outer membrane protein assembly factor BamA [Desulfobacteraceae bacterium]